MPSQNAQEPACGLPVDAAHEAQVEQALEAGIAGVRSPRHAERTLDALEAAAGRLTETDVADGAAPTLPNKRGLPGGPPRRALAGADVIVRTAQEIAAAPPGTRATLDEAVAQAAGTGSAGAQAKAPEVQRGRSLLREALLRRLGRFDKADAKLFIAINHLPHPPLVDRVLSGLSWAMTGGHGWIALLAAGALVDRPHAFRSFRATMPALWLTTFLVEGPVKKFFRRRRPFVSLVRAIVVGRKPGNYSFPSGHSAAAAAGAVLLGRCFPRGRPLFNGIAGAVMFSRVYLGAHYPGDVVSGGIIGAVLCKVCRGLLRRVLRF